MIGFHAFGVIRVTFKRANAKIPIIHIPPLGHCPPISHPTLSFVLQVYRKAAVTGTALLSFSSAPRSMYLGMHDTPLQSAALSGVDL